MEGDTIRSRFVGEGKRSVLEVGAAAMLARAQNTRCDGLDAVPRIVDHAAPRR